eukprot:scaffold10383_cov117-Isochrysis_galbana.AAC.5
MHAACRMGIWSGSLLSSALLYVWCERVRPELQLVAQLGHGVVERPLAREEEDGPAVDVLERLDVEQLAVAERRVHFIPPGHGPAGLRLRHHFVRDLDAVLRLEARADHLELQTADGRQDGHAAA